jgi:putative photosynthetic complex assembly protein 2
MAAYVIPILFTLLLWWASTALILFLDGLDRRTFIWSLGAATALLAGSLWGLGATSADASVSGAYLAFTFGLLVWGWQLVSFYMGYVTGPRTTACEPGLKGWMRFVEAVRTSIYHELAIVVSAVALGVLLWRQPNQFGLWTFLVLWWMHQSAKLNIYFGVPNLGAELLPEHLRYLQSFMTRKSMNLLFPVSVSLSTIVAVLLTQRALAASASPFEAAGYTMLATLMVLAIAEHWFLVAPIEANSLWGFGVKAEPSLLTMEPDGSSNAAASAGRPRFAAAANDDSDYPAPDMGGASLESWSASPPALCDARGLRRLLESVGAGAFGDVESLKGIVKTSASWIRFEVAGERSSIAAFAPQRSLEPLAIAMGRRVDRARLQAAFDACSDSA